MDPDLWVTNGPVYSVARRGGTIYIGGDFTRIGGETRTLIGALDAATGTAAAWNPNARIGYYPAVVALTVSGNTVYAGGTFTSIGGQPQSYVAAIPSDQTSSANRSGPVASSEGANPGPRVRSP